MADAFLTASQRSFVPTPPKSPIARRSSTPRSPVTKTRSSGMEQDALKMPVERFLSVDQSSSKSRLGRRKSGHGLQDLSSRPVSPDGSKHNRGRRFTELLNPLKSYARRKSQSSRESSSSSLSSVSSLEEGITGDSDLGSKSIFSMIARSSRRYSKSLNTSRRNSVDSNDSFKNTRKSRKSTTSDKRKNSLEVTKSRMAADALEKYNSRKPECTKVDPEARRKDSIAILRERRQISESRSATQSPVFMKKESSKKSKDKTKVRKKRSLGETLSLKLPVGNLRRNSMDVFSLKSLFSLSRKNSSEDLRRSSLPKSEKEYKKNLENSLLKVVQMEATHRRHSHTGGDTSSDSSYVYKPMSRPRNRLGSLGVNRFGVDLKPNVVKPRSRTPSIVVNNTPEEYDRSSRRRSSGGVSVVVSPATDSSSYDSNDVSEGSSVSSGSFSHSSITSLESEQSDHSADSDRWRSRAPPHRRLRSKQIFNTAKRHSSGSQSSNVSDDVFESMDSDEESDEGSPPRGDFWASLQNEAPPTNFTASSDEDIYNIYDEYIFDGRRNSGDLHDRSRHSSGSLSSVYIRGSMNPDIVAGVFRDARKLPVVDPKIINLLSEEDESQILVKFFKLHHSYDLIPTSAKLVIFDTSLQVKKAFYALVHNGVRAAPLWDHTKQQFVGMLTITDFIRILQSFHHNSDAQMSDLEDHRLHMWRTMLKDEDKPLITITPDESLFEAISSLIRHKIHRLPVIDPATGNVLYIITHKRILKFLFLYIRELPKPTILSKTIGELNIGTYDNIETARPSTLIIEALDKFVERRISALPIVDDDGVLVDIYAKFDVLNLAAEGTYHQLDVTLSKANESRNEWFEGVLYCTRGETLNTVMNRIVNAEVHRLVVVDEAKKVVGVLSLSDILNEIVMKPANNTDLLKKATELTVGDAATDSAIDTLKTLDIQSGAVGGATELDNIPPVEELIIPPAEVILPEEPMEGVATPPIAPADAVSPPPPEVIGGVKGSPIDSEDEGRYSMDKSEESPPPLSET